MQFAHIDIPCQDTEKSKNWYLSALSPINVTVQSSFPISLNNGAKTATVFGLGTDPKSILLWLQPAEPGYNGRTSGHVAFKVETRAQVDSFYAAAVAAGGEDNGSPGLRPLYSANYYAAFVRDLDGRNVELVTFADQ
ncbi:hypothetical protein HK100_007396 [Physocladia obscura]|uniref:VOC domain-containing protein n=1 Tax=Physocladia obscura TaxID=109957 RepID=A0AAD5XIA1_9FUNG|nr:hypothetical protein HK100_007396 [Physocladia obscura]